MFEKVLPSRNPEAGAGQQNSSRVTHKPGSYPSLQQKAERAAQEAEAVVNASRSASLPETLVTNRLGARAEAPESPNRLIVGPDVKLKGAEILDCDTLVVEGHVEATMDSRVLRIAENGAFAGKVSIDVAEIHGKFEGDLTARNKLVIHSTGCVLGTIRYGSLLIEDGGRICGDVQTLEANSQELTDPAINKGKEADRTKVSLLSSVA